jgi:hypothetical protein
MQSKLKLLILLVLFWFPPLPIFYTLLSYEKFLIISYTYSLIIMIFFFFSDKIILAILKSREMIESDHDHIFQLVKHLSFRNSMKTPSLYIYRGHFPKIFMLKSRSKYSLVFEESIFDRLTDKEIQHLLSFLFRDDKSGSSRILTLSYLFSITIVKLLLIFKDIVHYLTRSKSFSQGIFLSLIFVMKPFILFVFWLSINSTSDLHDQILEDHYLNSAFSKLYSQRITESFSDVFLVLNNIIESNSKILDANILELFPTYYIKLKRIYD